MISMSIKRGKDELLHWSTLAKAFDITEQRIGQIANERKMRRDKAGYFPALPMLTALREQAERALAESRGEVGQVKLAREKVKLAREHILLEEAQGKLLDLETARQLYCSTITETAQRLTKLGDSLGKICSHQDADFVADRINIASNALLLQLSKPLTPFLTEAQRKKVQRAGIASAAASFASSPRPT